MPLKPTFADPSAELEAPAGPADEPLGPLANRSFKFASAYRVLLSGMLHTA